MTKKIYFITYGDNNFNIQRKRISYQAKKLNVFNKIYSYKKSNIDKKFLIKYSNLFKDEKGGGYWVWKAYFVLKTFEEMNYGDILLYTDAGSTLNTGGKARLNNYIDMISNSKEYLLMFQIKHLIEKEWTVKEIFSYFKLDNNSTIPDSSVLMGGVFFAKKTNHAIKFFTSFLDIVDKDNNLITDVYQDLQEEYFQECRHDQSLMSVMAKLNGCLILDDETYFNDNPNQQYSFPILTVRDGKYSIWQKLKYYILYPLNIKKTIYFGKKQFYFKRRPFVSRMVLKLKRFIN